MVITALTEPIGHQLKPVASEESRLCSAHKITGRSGCSSPVYRPRGPKSSVSDFQTTRLSILCKGKIIASQRHLLVSVAE